MKATLELPQAFSLPGPRPHGDTLLLAELLGAHFSVLALSTTTSVGRKGQRGSQLGAEANTHIEGVQQGLGGHLGPVGKSMREFGADVVAVVLQEVVQQTLLPEDLPQLLPPFQGQPGTSTKLKTS